MQTATEAQSIIARNDTKPSTKLQGRLEIFCSVQEVTLKAVEGKFQNRKLKIQLNDHL